MSRERNTGWERVRTKRKRKQSVRENLREGPRLTYAGKRNGHGQSYKRAN